jgi:hypothetical protein
MNRVSVLSIVCLIVIIFIIPKMIPYSKSYSPVNYAPNCYKQTFDMRINGMVTQVQQEGLYWVTINNQRLPFSYNDFKLPEGWQKNYPKDFIQVGDSISKKEKNDTFYLIRGELKWEYSLPVFQPTSKQK